MYKVGTSSGTVGVITSTERADTERADTERADTAPPKRRRAIEHPGRFAIVAGGLMVVATLIAITLGTADTTDVKNALPNQVRSASPSQGSIVPPQEQISVDLGDDLVGDLRVCNASGTCTEIPFDQVDFIKPLGQLVFRPEAGKEISAWDPGRVDATVTFRSQADPAQDNGSYSWWFISKA